jgi:hypothetical protein
VEDFDSIDPFQLNVNKSNAGVYLFTIANSWVEDMCMAGSQDTQGIEPPPAIKPRTM